MRFYSILRDQARDAGAGGMVWMVSQGSRAGRWWPVLVVVVVSTAWELSFVHHGIAWLFDEGWPLYAAMQLHAGGTLYDDVFFLFPPGHVWPAWIAQAVDPPGVILARTFYAGFNVALCVALYALGRRLMPVPFALLGALLLAVAAPRSHLSHLLFGYRYAVFAVLALLAFAARLRTGDVRWMLVAGLCTGVGVVFRLTPAFAVSCGIAIAAVAAELDPRRWLRDGLAFGVGLGLVLLPVLLWFALHAGIGALWEQAVLRILPLQAMQSKPIPALQLTWSRVGVFRSFVTAQYWLYPVLYAGVLSWLAVRWARNRRRGEPLGDGLLLAATVWGAVLFLRTLGRSDEHHLTSALPPACLLLAWLASRLPVRGAAALGVAAVVLASWVFLQGSDLYLSPSWRGTHPLASLSGEVSIRDPRKAQRIDRRVRELAVRVGPGERFLDLGHAPLLHVLSGRRGPGHADVVTPGVFADPEEERRFVERLESAPPVLVLWPDGPFDGLASRSLEVTAPRLSHWVKAHYAPARDAGDPGLWVRAGEGGR